MTSLPSPVLRKRRPSICSSSRRSSFAAAAGWRPSFHTSSNFATAASWMRPRLCSSRVTSSQLPSGSTIRHQARFHSTAFLPPAFMAMLPPTHDESAEVGSTANTSPAASAASATRRVTTPAPVSTVGTSPSTPGSRSRSTAPIDSSFSVLITAARGVSGTHEPV